jgi:hypothetical protein
MFHGKPNNRPDPPRDPDDDDAIAYTTDLTPGQCPRLQFLTNENGAYKSPEVVFEGRRKAITLRTNEMPISGFSEGGKMYVIFGTDNDIANPGKGEKGSLDSAPRRTVLAVSEDDGATFRYLYDFSKGTPSGKFINVPVAKGPEGALLFWGAEGGELYRRSAPYFAFKNPSAINQPGGMQYFIGLGDDGKPRYSSSEADAVPLFHDVDDKGQVADCIGEFGVAYNPYVNRWVMLYNCKNVTKTNMAGVYMRLSQQPWGPWSDPETIFNARRDNGLCHFIHRAVTADQPACDDLTQPARAGQMGGNYAPYFVSQTGDTASGTSTLYFTMAIWNPYTQVLMQSSIQRR